MKKSDMRKGMLILIITSEYLEGKQGTIVEIAHRGDAITVEVEGETHILYPEELEELPNDAEPFPYYGGDE